MTTEIMRNIKIKQKQTFLGIITTYLQHKHYNNKTYLLLFFLIIGYRLKQDTSARALEFNQMLKNE
jgi:hypothetical protein